MILSSALASCCLDTAFHVLTTIVYFYGLSYVTEQCGKDCHHLVHKN